MAKITRKEIISKLLDARAYLHVACRNTVGSQQQHLTQQWAHMNDMLAILACDDRQKLNQITDSAKHWAQITENKS